jgi:hypothetical protein
MLTHAQKVKILQEVSECSDTPELLRLKLTEYWLYLNQVKQNHVHTDYDHLVLRRFNDLTDWSAGEEHVVLIPETLYFLHPKIDKTYPERANRLREMAKTGGRVLSDFFCPTAYFGWRYWKDPRYDGKDWELTSRRYPICCADFIQHAIHIYNCSVYSENPYYATSDIQEKVRSCFSLSRGMHVEHISEIIRIFLEETGQSRAKLLRLFFGKGDISKLSCAVPTWLFAEFTDLELSELDKKAAEWCNLAYDYFDLLITLWDYLDHAGVGDLKRLVKDYKKWMQK